MAPLSLLAGIGTGLARVPEQIGSLDGLLSLSGETVLRLLAVSRQLARRLLGMISHESGDQWSRFVCDILDFPDVELRARARRRILPYLRHPAHAHVLTALLKDIDTSSLVSVVRGIWAVTHFEVQAFDDPLRRAARGERGIASLRETILLAEDTPFTNRVLLSTLRPEASDVRWLCDEEKISSNRRATLLEGLLTIADDRQIQFLAQDGDLSARLEEILLSLVPGSAGTLARLLMWGSPNVERLLSVGLELLPSINGATRSDLLNTLLSRGLGGAPRSCDSLVGRVLDAASGEINARQIIILATAPTCAVERLSANLELLNGAPENLRHLVLAKIDELTERLVQRLRGNLDESAIGNWARMLEDAGRVDSRARLRASNDALSFALRAVQSPVSPIIIVAFPLVYRELKSAEETPGWLSAFLFSDWDRCRIARRDLVLAFMQSSWPPANLLLAALDTGDTQEVLYRLSREYRGEAYLSSIERDLGRLPSGKRSVIQKEIETFRRRY